MKACFFVLLVTLAFFARGQDGRTLEQHVTALTSEYMWGRGYTKNGMNKAAEYILAQLRSIDLQPATDSGFSQAFSFPVNTFPGKMELCLNGKDLKPGREFIVNPFSRGTSGSGTLVAADSITFVDTTNRIALVLKDKLTWSVAKQVADFTAIEVLRSASTGIPKQVTANIEQTFLPDFAAQNICAVVKGTRKPDSILMITAHYDHLGGMGSDTFFPGANDNASGVAFLLTLAKHYAEHPQPYSIAFLFFAAEEAGLEGSKYFTEHPLFPLDQIRFLINVDMVGTGDSGATVVNATIHEKEFALLKHINERKKYLSQINARGKAANSDHYFFSERGVPAFFIYTQGKRSAYHDVHDVAATLPFSAYENLFNLVVEFNEQLSRLR